MDKELQIIITGQAASGKSSMLFFLERMLIANGFNVVLDLTLEGLDYGSESRFRQLVGENFSKKEEALMKNTKITLKTVQMARKPYGSKEKPQTQNQTNNND
jgi:adenylylsulfate kinase-like enzyme